jgi:hypothetical protein
VNLWTVGCADPRLTAQARSPMDKPGKTPYVSPTLPTGRRLPTSFTAPRNKKRSIRFRGNGETISRLPAFSLFLPGSCPNNRDRRTTIFSARSLRRPIRCLSPFIRTSFLSGSAASSGIILPIRLSVLTRWRPKRESRYATFRSSFRLGTRPAVISYIRFVWITPRAFYTAGNC